MTIHARCPHIFLLASLFSVVSPVAHAQAGLEQKIDQLASALSRTEAELAATQHELTLLREQISGMRQQLSDENTPSRPAAAVSSSRDVPEDHIAERLAAVEEQEQVERAQIAVQHQSKVETQLKSPLRVSGLLLMNAFVNTAGVDAPTTPTFAISGGGSTSASLRQTILGFDATGPHVLGAETSADLRVDFSGAASAATYSSGFGLLRLRTAHAAMDWSRTSAFVALDRTLLNPESPTSLTALAQPALAWSGNLWFWNPQYGVEHTFGDPQHLHLAASTALLDISDPPAYTTSAVAQTTLPQPTAAERSRYPGAEGTVALVSGAGEHANRIGAGGYISPHRVPGQYTSNAWAATLDYRIELPARLRWSGNVYRGQGLGGLGAGTYKDYLFRRENEYPVLQWLDDVGGWTELSQQITNRVQWNLAFGVDNTPAHQIRPFLSPDSSAYVRLSRNRTATANVIFQPNAAVELSLEYRNLFSAPADGPGRITNLVGAAAGYRF